MINKKGGTIGTGLTAPVVFIFVLFIMGTFAFVSAGAFKIVKPNNEITSDSLDLKIPYNYDFMNSIILVLIGTEIQRLPITEMIVKRDFGEITKDNFENALNVYSVANKKCILLEWKQIGKTHSAVFLNGISGDRKSGYFSNNAEFKDIEENYPLSPYQVQFSVNTNTGLTNYSVQYYYGECKNG